VRLQCRGELRVGHPPGADETYEKRCTVELAAL
ncbi:hypothetical protein AK812_SmicGene48936, partial [Symbiodinium microadriaticum]